MRYRRVGTLRTGCVENLGHVAGPRSDVEHRRRNAQDVVDLAGMHEPDEGVAHCDDLQIATRQRGAELVQWLVGQAAEIAVTSRGRTADELLGLPPLTSPADEAKDSLWLADLPLGRGQQRVQRMHRTVVARVHDHEFALEPVAFPESLTARTIIAHLLVV